LQYAHARAGGVLRKAGRSVGPDIDFGLLCSEPERNLVKVLGRHPNAVARARQDDEPCMVAAQALDVASALNLFYNKCRVLGEDRPIEDARLFLVWCAKQVLAEALGMLGITAPESM
jgi:arginyl-tRNA synthetase